MPNALQAALTSVASAPIENPTQAAGWLRVTGADRVRWLNGMVTNSIQALQPGEGCYNFVLNAQGRIQADCTAWLQPEAVLLQTADPEALTTLLDRFIIMDDVELAPEPLHGLLLAGPAAAETLRKLGLPAPDPLCLIQAGETTVLHAHSPLIARYEVWSATPIAPWDVPRLSPEDLLHLRLLEGTPLVGIDIRDRDLPQETALPGTQSRALHFSKGCYLGQEIVERIRSRGQVHRTLEGFVLHGELAATGAPLTFEGKPAGEITSAALIPLPAPVQLALGTVRREALERSSPGNTITYPGGVATPTALPFQTAG